MSKYLEIKQYFFLKKLRIKEEITRKFRNYFELSKKENPTYQIFWGTAKAVVKNLNVILQSPSGQLEQK